MSSPSIPRCKSVPSIPDAAKHSPSVKTSKSAESVASVLQKITRKKWASSSSSSSKNSNLTVENMKEFDRRNDIREGKREPSSPYYRGLTDQKIGIEKQKLAESSPLRENYPAAAASFSVAMNASIVKIQEWRNSRFVSKGKEDRTVFNQETSLSRTQVKSRRTGKEEEMKEKEKEEKEVHDHNSSTDLYTLLSKEKPMREKVSRTTQVKSTKSAKDQGKKQEIHHSSRTGRYASMGKEKSLRERVSEQPPPLPQPPITAPSLPPQLPEPFPPLPQISLPSPPPTPLVQTSEQDEESSLPPTQGKYIAEGEETVAEQGPLTQGKSIAEGEETVAEKSPPTQGKPVAEEEETVAEKIPPTRGKPVAEEEEIVAEQSEMKFIWADKHRPQALKDFLCNRDIALELQALVININFLSSSSQ